MKQYIPSLTIPLLVLLLLAPASTAQGSVPVIDGQENYVAIALVETTINITISDNNPRSYQIIMVGDGDVVSEGEWEDTGSILAADWVVEYTIYINAGTYDFTLEVDDYDNNTASFSFTVNSISGEEDPSLPLSPVPVIAGLMLVALVIRRR